MYYKTHPSVNEVGKLLESEGLVAFGKRAYNQVGNNCFEVASRLADLFSYRPIESRQELADIIASRKRQRLWGGQCSPVFSRRSPVYFVIREPDNPIDVHVTLEAFGREYNYGPSTEQGFCVEIRIPLFRQS